MDGRTFHMTDLHNRKNDFDGISGDDTDRIMRGIVDIINRYASYLTCTSYDGDLISEKFPKASNDVKLSDEFLHKAFRTKYGPMTHMCMWAMGRFATGDGKRRRAGNNISYVLEAGDEGQGGFVSYINFLINNSHAQPVYKHVLDYYSVSQLTISPKDSLEGIFHAADFVAWEWARHVDRQRRSLPIRKSLQALCEQSQVSEDYYGMNFGNQSKVFFRHYAEKHANRLVKFLRETAESTKEADLVAANAHWAETRF